MEQVFLTLCKWSTVLNSYQIKNDLAAHKHAFETRKGHMLLYRRSSDQTDKNAGSSISGVNKKEFDSCVAIKILETLANPPVFKFSYT